MSLKIDRVQLEIVIQKDSARQRLMELDGDMKQIRKELKGMKEGTEDYIKKSEELKKVQKEYDALFDKIGIGSLSVKELRNRQKELNTILNQLPGDSPLYKQYKQQLDDINLRMKELKGNAVETKFSLKQLADGFNRYAAISAGLIASLTGVAMTSRKCVDEFAEMQEAQSQVRKYTGMTTEEVNGLNEEFKRMDTRTARDRLNDLAGDAGRLGITAKEGVLEFVDAANMINVALGEDLGEDAVKNIGKLALMFGEDKHLGLRGAMLATGSAINEVAQNSSAAEAYLVEFTARVAGAANQAKVAQGDILGYASVLDQNMQKQEMAATAFQTLMMKMYQDPAKFAKLAGKEVKEFTELIKVDANEAILQFLQTLNGKGGLDKLAPMFKEMGLDGVRASGVISTMASKIDDIRVAQQLANGAYRDGTSIINEYNVQNTTVQAELDKARKRFKDIRIELGEQLLPVMRYMVTTGSMTVKGLSVLIGSLSDYKGTVAATALAIVGYTIAVNASVLADKLKVLWTGKVVTGLKVMYATLKAHPYAFVASLVGLVVGRLIDLKRSQDSVTESMRAMNRVNETTQKNYDDQSYRVKNLVAVLHNEKMANEYRKKCLDDLREIIPGYNGMLDEEGKLINDNTDAIKDYLVQLERQIKMKAAEEELEELYRSQRSTQKQLTEDEGAEKQAKTNLNAARFAANSRASQASTSGAKTLTANLDQGVKTMQTEYNNAAEAVKKTKDELQGINEAIETINKEIAASIVASKEVVEVEETGGGGGGGLGDEEKKKLLKAKEEELKKTMNLEQNASKEAFFNKKKTEEEYNAELYKSEIKFLLSKRALFEKFGEDTSEIQGQIYDKMISEADRLAKAQKDADKKAMDGDLKGLDSTYEADKLALKQQYLNGEIKTEKEFQDKMKELEVDYLHSRIQIQEKYGEDTTKTAGQLADKELEIAKDSKEKQKKAQEKAIEKTVKLDDKLDILKAMYDADLINYEEYEKAKKDITDKYEKSRTDTTKASLEVFAKAAQATGDVVNAMMDREISKIALRYDKEIKAAKKAGKDTTKLEESKEEEINAIRRKYADKQFMAAVLQVTATTAVTAMEAYKAMAGIPVVGPALGAIASAAAIASGAAQIQVAKQQRDEAKGLKTGGYSQEYVEGFTASGNPDDVAGVIPVHKNEFVANHYGVANPHVRQFLDVFNIAQKNGTIRMLNTTQILEQVRTRSGRYSGGFTDDDQPSSGNGWPADSSGTSGGAQIQRVIALLVESNRLLDLISKKDLNIDGRAMRDSIRRVERLEKNVSR